LTLKLEKWALVAEIVGGIAVVLSLIFVGFEIQRNSEAQVRATTQNVVSEFNASMETLTESAEMSCIYAQGIQDFSGLAGADQVRLSAFLIRWNRVVEEIFFLERDGAVEPQIWAAIASQQQEVAQLPGFQQWFSVRRHWLSPDYQAFVIGLIENQGEAAPFRFDDPDCQTR